MEFIHFPSPLDHSVITSVWISLIFSCFFNLRFGWVFSGLVCSGYLAPLLVVDPRIVILIYIEAAITYLFARYLTELGPKLKIWTSFFGRDRFFVIILVSIVVRILSDLYLIPYITANTYTLGSMTLDFNHFIANKSIGLVAIPLLANAFWKTGLLRGVYCSGVNLGLSYIAVVYVLTSISNFSVIDLSYFYESFSLGIDASPRAYIVLVMTAYVASRYNLLYGWDFSGILVPALLTITINYPSKIAITIIESVVIYLLAQKISLLPGLKKINFIGARKTFLFFTTGYMIKVIISYVLGQFDLPIKTSDFFGFGYLVSTLLAVKYTAKGNVIGTIRSTIQICIVSALCAFAVGYSLYKAPITDIVGQKNIENKPSETKIPFNDFLYQLKHSYYSSIFKNENIAVSSLMEDKTKNEYKKVTYGNYNAYVCKTNDCDEPFYVLKSKVKKIDTVLVIDFSEKEFPKVFDKLMLIFLDLDVDALTFSENFMLSKHEQGENYQPIYVSMDRSKSSSRLEISKALKKGIQVEKLQKYSEIEVNWSAVSKSTLKLGSEFLSGKRVYGEKSLASKKLYSLDEAIDRTYNIKDQQSLYYFREEILLKLLKKSNMHEACYTAKTFAWSCVESDFDIYLKNTRSEEEFVYDFNQSTVFVYHEVTRDMESSLEFLNEMLSRGLIAGFYIFKRDGETPRNIFSDDYNNIESAVLNTVNITSDKGLLNLILKITKDDNPEFFLIPTAASLGKILFDKGQKRVIQLMTNQSGRKTDIVGEYGSVSYETKINLRRYNDNYFGVLSVKSLDQNKKIIYENSSIKQVRNIKVKNNKNDFTRKKDKFLSLSKSQFDCSESKMCKLQFNGEKLLLSSEKDKFLVPTSYSLFFDYCDEKNLIFANGYWGCAVD